MNRTVTMQQPKRAAALNIRTITISTGLLCGRGLHRLQAVLFRLPAEVHRHYQEACGD